jgi:hypothetical protein
MSTVNRNRIIKLERQNEALAAAGRQELARRVSLLLQQHRMGQLPPEANGRAKRVLELLEIASQRAVNGSLAGE